MIAALWIVTGALLALWSGLAWGLYALVTADPVWLESFRRYAGGTSFGEWLDRLWPSWFDALSAALGLVHAVLHGLASALPWVIGGVWAVVSLLVLLLTAVLHGVIRASARAEAAYALAQTQKRLAAEQQSS
jgi:hypothetical protein